MSSAIVNLHSFASHRPRATEATVHQTLLNILRSGLAVWDQCVSWQSSFTRSRVDFELSGRVWQCPFSGRLGGLHCEDKAVPLRISHPRACLTQRLYVPAQDVTPQEIGSGSNWLFCYKAFQIHGNADLCRQSLVIPVLVHCYNALFIPWGCNLLYGAIAVGWGGMGGGDKWSVCTCTCMHSVISY